MKILFVILISIFSLSNASAADIKLVPGYYSVVKSEPEESSAYYNNIPKDCAFKIDKSWGKKFKAQWIDGGIDQFCLKDREVIKYKPTETEGLYSEDRAGGAYQVIQIINPTTFVYLEWNTFYPIKFTFSRVESKPAQATLITGTGDATCRSIEKTCSIDGKAVPFKEVTEQMIAQSSFCEKGAALASKEALQRCSEIYPDKKCVLETRKNYILINQESHFWNEHNCVVTVGARAK